MSDCGYTNTLRAGFARTITYEALNEQFEAIEASWACLEELVSELEFKEENRYDHGVVTDNYAIDPGLGHIQFITIQGDVTFTIDPPNEGDPLLITLMLHNGGGTDGTGDALFNFNDGLIWVTDSHSATRSMDGKAWDVNGLAGDYGAALTCIWDGLGWVILSFSRNDIDTSAAADVTDLYNWR